MPASLSPDTIVHHAAPADRWAGIVKCFWEVRVQQGQEATTALVVPDGSPELLVELGHFDPRGLHSGREFSDASAVLAGQLTRAFELGTPPGYHAFGMRLHPWGAALVLPDEVSALTDRVIDVDTCLGHRGRSFAEQIMAARDFQARVRAAERWLDALAPRRPIAAWLPLASRRLAAGTHRVPALAATIGLSTRQLERVFLRSVGLPPKAFARQQRFARAAGAMDGVGSLAELAQACDYADQAHMARDFRAFAGMAPSALGARLDRISTALAGIERGDVGFVQVPGWQGG